MTKHNGEQFPYPVYFLTDKVELPKTGNYYVIAQDGVYLHKDTGLIQATVKVNKISFLNPLMATATVRLPVIPPHLAAQALLFFRRVFVVRHSEAVLLIHFSESDGYVLTCPKQDVSFAMVDYEPTERIDGYRLVGSFHSHCNFGAFHSGVDVADEVTFDGLHITIGRVDQPYPTLSTTTVVNDNRFAMDPENVISGLHKVDYTPSPAITHRRPRVIRLDGDIPVQQGNLAELLDVDFWGMVDNVMTPEKSQHYDIVLPFNQDYRNVGFPGQWMKQVHRKPLTSDRTQYFGSPQKKPTQEGKDT